MPQYQGIWTLQDAARLQSQQQWVTDPNFKNTTLLLQADNAANGAQNNTFLDSSPNSFNLSRLGNATQGTFTPFSQGWSNFFNGGSAISAGLSTFSSVNFTIEGWIYLNATATGTPQIIATTYNLGGVQTGTFIFGVGGNGFLFAQNHGAAASGSTIVAANTWHHVAMTYTLSTTTIQVFLNGISQGTASAPITTSSGFMNIGGNPGDNNTGTWFLNGYISNFRATRSQVLYSGLFSPAISPLSTTSVGSTGSGAATSITGTVSLLTCQSNRFVDNSASPLTISTSSVPSVQPFAPFAPQFQYTQSGIGGSGYFDGDGDNIQSPASTNLSIGTGDFTFECWAYLVSQAGDPGIMQIAGGPFGTNLPTYTNSIGIFNVTSSGRWAYILGGNYSVGSISSTNNAWTHLAVCRSGTTHRLFVNGQIAASNTDSTNYTTQYFAAGCAYGTNFESNAYISNIRFLRGTASYTTAFTPPTALLTSVANTQLLCNFTNAGIIDGTMDNVLETVGNAQVSTNAVKYGSGSIFFDGTGDYLSAPANPNFNFGSGDFTIEFWLYPTSHPATVYLAGQTNSSDFAPVLCFLSNGRPGIAATSASGSWTINVTSTTTLVLNAWTHVAYVRFGNKWSVYINGVETVLAPSTAVNTYTSTDPLGIGGEAVGTLNYPYFGYMDDVRITKGVARYTANFTPPQVALPRQ